jgi:hypothetical protein
MEGPLAAVPEASRPRRRVSLALFLSVCLLLVVAGGLAVYFAAQAADAIADLELLSDGIDRSRLPREEAVALATVARSRSESLAPDAGHHHDHDEGHAMMAPLSPDEQATLAAQLDAATEAVARLDTPEEAAAHGYVQASGETDGIGKHWVKWSIVDRPFDPAAPSMLLFDELTWGDGEQLIAYSYWVASPEEPAGFAGDTDQWHRHLGVCFENGWIKDEGGTSDACRGDWINGSDLWMLHAWVVPGVENADGIFATVNRRLCERACGLED